MDWQAISAVGEILGAVSVLATLIFIARQIRDQNRALQTTIRDSAFHQLQEWNYAILGDSELSLIFQRGALSPDWSDLEESERARLVHVMYSFFKLFENIYLHSIDGSITPDVWERNKAVFTAYAGRPGCQYYLERRRPTFDPRFLVVVDSVGDAPMPSGGEVARLTQA